MPPRSDSPTAGYLHSCGTRTVVRDSRRNADGLRRRRYCPTCNLRFTTHEVEQYYTPAQTIVLRLRALKLLDRITDIADLLRAEHEP